ncbi:MAG: hypothetical protein ACRELY_28595 [Polyangiaceae bacterium]
MRFLRCAGLVVFVATPAIASPGARFSAEVTPSGHATDAKIVVHRRGVRAPIARIDPNPGGRTRNLEVRFVTRDRVLASWSCGAPCDVATLFTVTGTQLAVVANAERFEVSPDARVAVVFDETIGKPFAGGRVRVVDLATGATTVAVGAPDVWNVCDVRWQAHGVTLLPCDAKTRNIRLVF